MFFSRTSVHACVPNYCSHDIFKNVDGFPPKLTAMMRWRWGVSFLGSKRQISSSLCDDKCWRSTFIGLTCCLEKYRADFHQSYGNNALSHRDDGFKFGGQKVEVQGHRAIKYAGSSGLRAEA